MISRRKMIKMISGAPLLGGLFGGGLIGSASSVMDRASYRNYLQELGVPVTINARGHNTIMTGSLMMPEVMAAINSTANDFVDLEVLQDKAGERIASMLRCEGAMVTAGAASALTLGTAACVTGTDAEKIVQLPDLPGPQKEVIVQKSHRFGYDHAVRNTGIKFVEVETRRELERAVNENTVMMFYFNRGTDNGRIKHEEFIELAQKHGLPTLIDCAAELPPVDNLWRFTGMGFDLVAFSGGKEIRGPQSAGLLLGRKDLIEAAREQSNPKGNTIGRGMKVNKEEIVGMTIAVETYLEMDHQYVLDERMARVKYVGDHVGSLRGVEQEIQMKEKGYTGQVNVPVLRVSWDSNIIRRSSSDILDSMITGHPSIIIGGGNNSVSVNLRMERNGTERIVARRLHEELSKGYT